MTLTGTQLRTLERIALVNLMIGISFQPKASHASPFTFEELEGGRTD